MIRSLQQADLVAFYTERLLDADKRAALVAARTSHLHPVWIALNHSGAGGRAGGALTLIGLRIGGATCHRPSRGRHRE